MLFTATKDDIKAEMLKALGLENNHGVPAWPLPNLKASDEKSFWGWRASYSFQGEAWMGQIKIGGEYANVILFYVGHSRFIDGGFAVAIFRNYQKERVEYFEWRSCEHEFSRKNIGNCLNKYTCSKCGKSYDVDSSG
jgi:hypothetical protein